MGNRNQLKSALKSSWDAADSGDFVGALAEIQKVLALAPDWPRAWATKAEFLCSLKRHGEAEIAIRRAITLDPDLDIAWTVYGHLNADIGASRRAAYCYRRSVSLRTDPYVLTLLAAQELCFDPIAAASSAQEALRLRPDWEEARSVLDAARREIQKGERPE